MLLTGCSGDSPDSWQEYTAQGIYSATLSPDGSHAIVGSTQHGGSYWDTRRHERLYDWNHKQGEYTNIVDSSFSPDGRFAATASSIDLVLWNTDDGSPIWYWIAPAEVLSIALSNNGDYALLGLGNHQAVYFDIKNGGILRTLLHPARVRSVALDNTASLALTGDDAYAARLWDMSSGKELHSVSFNNTVDTVALSGDGRFAFSSATLDKAYIWDTRSGQILHTLSGDEMLWQKRISYISARFSNDGSQLLTGSASGSVQLWDVSTGKQLRKWQTKKREAYGPTSTSIEAVGFGNDGRYYAIGSNGLINVLR
ncbi:WD40 repeat domain-containing protein [Marinobacterium lutimaris]|uniref:WD40 repeat domain-containing protein n=1 Tax=Marinobacterium lutimaris TaxID=568106 RepID=UPI001F448251|nr:PQQ-binding-like beta-propeller repeat protein [Marinobacterium lutimaris]